MRCILAIATIALRGAVRSRIMVMLLALLLLAIVGLPLTIRGDGTLTGDMRILLNYTLSFARVILSIATVWAGCAALSQEVDEKQIQLIVTKPVHPWKIWLGKWLGIAGLNLVLVLFSGTVVYGMVRWNTRDAVLSESEREQLRREILVGRIALRPLDPEGLQREIDAAIEELRESGQYPEGVSLRELELAARSMLLYRMQSIPPGAVMRWALVSPGLPPGHPVTLDYLAASSQLGSGTVRGRWRTLDGEGRLLAEQEVSFVPDARQQVALPATALPPEGPFTLEYLNLERDITLIFAPDDSVELLGYAGSFEGSLARTLMIVFAHLCFLAAVGVSMGALFSFPVAAFTAVFVTLLSFMDRYIGGMAEETVYFTTAEGMDQSGFLLQAVNQFVGVVFRLMNLLVQPLQGPNPLELLASGRYVSWAFTGSLLLYRVLVYGGILAVIGAGLLRRRELALPSR